MAIRIEKQSEPIPGYKLLDRLGGGGFGEVWKVEAPGGLHKAMKIVHGDLHAEDETGVRRAEQELKSLKRVQSVRHPYLLSLERYDIVDNRLLIVMELADRNLMDRFRECRAQGLPGIPREELLRYMEEAAEVLDLMNTQYQLQHLDIKPQNLFLVHNHVKVADFGLVKDLEGMSASMTSGVTPVYAAPETFEGIVSRFCDQYSMAIVYQELLTGQRPFVGNTVQQLVLQHLSGTPNVTPLPAPERAIIARGLAKKPEDRHPSCSVMVEALRHAGGGRVETGAKPAETGAKPVEAGAKPAETGAKPVEAGARRVATGVRQVEDGGKQAEAGARQNASAPATLHPPPATIHPPPAAPVTTHPPPATRLAPAEVTGNGVLFPAVVVGLGGVGLTVLRRLQEVLRERLGSREVLPHVQLLYVDTDPEAAASAVEEAAGPPLAASEVVLARLNRPSHYLRLREGRLHIDTWFNFQMLYRMPRNPVTTGMRALGRLALIDNYASVAERLQQELEACTIPETLTRADQQTRLGIRSNRPKVYVVTSLAGGTGSGMFIDLACVARHLLFRMGYDRPEVVGVLLLPSVDRSRPVSAAGPQTMALGNAYAALTELNHFSTPGITYSGCFEEQAREIANPGPPFDRAVFLQMDRPGPPGGHSGEPGSAFGLAADLLSRELTTPLGRAADQARAECLEKFQPVGASCQAVGLYPFSWRRRTVIRRAGRLLTHRLIQHWVSREPGALRSEVQSWLAEQWGRQGLGPDQLIERLQQACARAVGEDPETLFRNLGEQFQPPKGWGGMLKRTEIKPAAVFAVMDRLEKILGRPTQKEESGRIKEERAPHSAIEGTLDQFLEELMPECTRNLGQLLTYLLEQPGFRLPGTEEAIHQICQMLELMLEHHEPLYRELGERSEKAFERIQSMLGSLQTGSGRRMTASQAGEMADAIQVYCKARYQSLVLWRVLQVYLTLQGQIGDQVREVEFCRTRLEELFASVERSVAAIPADASMGHGICLLPKRCQDLEQAVNDLLANVTPGDLNELDRRIQTMIQQQYTSLLYVCMNAANVTRSLETAIQLQAEAFLSPRLLGTDVLEMFLTRYHRDEDAHDAIATGYQEAGPELARGCSREQELRILALPAGPLRGQVTQLIEQALPEVRFGLTDSSDDILFYREQAHLPLARLPQMGPMGAEAYRQMTNLEHGSPHSRTDIAAWEALPAD